MPNFASNHDKVFIEQLEVYTTIGAYHWEQTITQKLLLTIEMDFDNRLAGRSDALHLALDYAIISQKVTEFITEGRFALIERVAEETAQLIFDNFPVDSLAIKVSKPNAVANATTVAVQIFRQRNEYEVL